MRIKRGIIIVSVFFLIMALLPIEIFAVDAQVSTIISDMQNVKNSSVNVTSGIGKVINIAIRLVRVAGTGIALIMVTMLGIKYMLASSNEKADIKKQAIPIVIGCTLLFAAVNVVAIIAELGMSLNS